MIMTRSNLCVEQYHLIGLFIPSMLVMVPECDPLMFIDIVLITVDKKVSKQVC